MKEDNSNIFLEKKSNQLCQLFYLRNILIDVEFVVVYVRHECTKHLFSNQLYL